MERIRSFDSDLTKDSLGAPAEKYLRQIFSDKPEDAGAFKTATQGLKAGLGLLSYGFGDLVDTIKK